MVRSKKIAGLALAAGVAIGGLTASTANAASASPCGGSSKVTTVNGTLPDGATYLLECPAGTWNGTLYLYSHGYVSPGGSNPAQDAGDPVTRAWMLGHGYALAGSSYASTGWAIAQALPDQLNTLNAFGRLYGQPGTTVAWGHSLGGVATWNTALDGAFAFQKLIEPSVQITNITDPAATDYAAQKPTSWRTACPPGSGTCRAQAR